MAGHGYSFGTGSVAVARLWHLGRVFEPSMGAVLAELVPQAWGSVVDLGCGPGASSTTLAAELGPERLVGLDMSAAFLSEARAEVPGLHAVLADATAPLPVRAPDLVYARYLLAHVVDPVTCVARWRGQLAPEGVVVIEDLESIDTPVPVFAEYLALAGGLVASRGATMHVGPVLAGVDDAETLINRTVALEVTAADAAGLFLPNLASWRQDPWVRAERSDAALDDLAARLADAGRSDAPPTTWHVRQLVAGRLA